jgi:hypothetical protein
MLSHPINIIKILHSLFPWPFHVNFLLINLKAKLNKCPEIIVPVQFVMLPAVAHFSVFIPAVPVPPFSAVPFAIGGNIFAGRMEIAKLIKVWKWMNGMAWADKDADIPDYFNILHTQYTHSYLSSIQMECETHAELVG